MHTPPDRSSDYMEVNNDGDVVVPDSYDEHGEIEDFMYPEEQDAVKNQERAAHEDREEAEFQELMDAIPSERQHAAQVDIHAQLAVIAVNRLVVLQDAVLKAAQLGDKVQYLRALKELDKHIEDNPGIAGSVNRQE